ncbi:glycosyltransferase family protein [Serratia ureilytica]|uniref:glycosyltransferase family protein n=1 Tax=Serratia ureilytica TaxID=300181 RepID=UPI001D17E2AE|nr:glycosyltransferase [Serratia ureilytica]MCC4106958.1 glycosyl transferase family 28 [Serratia ureilytica]
MQGKSSPRIAFYSHDTMGLGHIRRNILLASDVLNRLPDTEILLISGVRESGAFHLPKGADSVTLPTYLKTPEGHYRPRSLGSNVDHLVNLRKNIIYAALDAFDPDIAIIDNVPRGAMSELNPSLPMLKKKNTHLILGLRDIIDDPREVQRQWEKLDNTSAIRNYFSSVWVYGDCNFYDLSQAYHFDDDVKQKTSFIGYLDATRRPRLPTSADDATSRHHAPYALCVVGGGQDGFQLAQTFAQAHFPSGMTGILVTGAMMPKVEYDKLQVMAGKRHHLQVLRFVPEPLELLRRAECVIAMGGYNTITEILSFHKRALIVPRTHPRREQWIRARLLAEKQLVSCLHPQTLTLSAINTWLAAKTPSPEPRDILNFNGLETFTLRIENLLQAKRTELLQRKVG